MPNENYEMSQTRFGEALQAKMDAKGLSIRDVSDRIESTYEYVRRLVRGLSSPSKYMLIPLADILDWDIDEMRRLVTADKIKRTHGKIPIEIAGKNPDLEPFEHAWPLLNENQRGFLLEQLNLYVRQNKKRAREGNLRGPSVS